MLDIDPISTIGLSTAYLDSLKDQKRDLERVKAPSAPSKRCKWLHFVHPDDLLMDQLGSVVQHPRRKQGVGKGDHGFR